MLNFVLKKADLVDIHANMFIFKKNMVGLVLLCTSRYTRCTFFLKF